MERGRQTESKRSTAEKKRGNWKLPPSHNFFWKFLSPLSKAIWIFNEEIDSRDSRLESRKKKRKVHRLNCNPSAPSDVAVSRFVVQTVKCAICTTSSFNEFHCKRNSKAELELIEITGRCISQLKRQQSWKKFLFSSVYSTSFSLVTRRTSHPYILSQSEEATDEGEGVIIKISYDEASAMFILTNFKKVLLHFLIQL